MRVLLLSIILFTALTSIASAASDNSVPAVPDNPGVPEERAAAQQAVNRFLALVDHDREDEAWTDVSEIMGIGAGSLETWQENMTAMRADIGRPVSRRLLKIGFTDGLGDLPKGKYYILHFAGTFERATALEELAVVLERDKWRVAGYIVSGIKHRGKPVGSAIHSGRSHFVARLNSGVRRIGGFSCKRSELS
jgi:hypothetical protein